MKKLLVFITLFYSFSLLAENHYQISFRGHLVTDLKDYDHALRRQINHSYGPLVNTQAYGYRSTLNTNFTYQILNETKLNDKLTRIDYIFNGELLTEDRVDIQNFKVVVPIQAKETFSLAQYSKKCTMRAYRGNLAMFYYAWSPYFKGCNLKKGEAYEEFSLDSYKLKVKEITFKTKEILHQNELNLFYYFGSDFYSLRRQGHAGLAKKSLERKLRRQGFSYVYDEVETKAVFHKTSKELYSFYNKMTRVINGKKVNAYLLFGNPTEITPIPQREYFDYFKYALQKGSYIHYAGHAGLGSILDFSYLEKEYNEKMLYSDRKQLFYLDGCSTYFESTNFFFSKKTKKESLILITNGLSIRTDLVMPGVETTLDALIESLNSDKSIEGDDLISEINRKIDYIIRDDEDFALTNISEN